MRSTARVADASLRDRLFILIPLGLVVALSWGYLAYLSRQMSSSMQYDTMMAEMGMSMAAWTSIDVWLAFVMWDVMMIGMMGPSAAPVLLLFAAAGAGRRERQRAPVVGLFGLGYLAVWTGFSAVAALAQWLLHRAALLSPAMTLASPYLAGTILIGAGAYQLTPVKGACLAHCRSPLGFLMTNWRDGRWGAFQMGGTHGLYCLGCCWALMCVLFAVGVMNLAWVGALTALVLIEKIGPGGALTARIAGGAMVVAGVLSLLRFP